MSTEYVCIFFYVGTFIYNLEKVMIALHSARISLWKNIWNFFSQLFKLNPNYKRRRNAWMFKEVGKLVLSDSVIFVWGVSRRCGRVFNSHSFLSLLSLVSFWQIYPWNLFCLLSIQNFLVSLAKLRICKVNRVLVVINVTLQHHYWI